MGCTGKSIAHFKNGAKTFDDDDSPLKKSGSNSAGFAAVAACRGDVGHD